MKLPELKKKLQNRYAVRVVAGVLSIVLLGGSLGTYTVYADKSNGKAAVAVATKETLDEEAMGAEASDKSMEVDKVLKDSEDKEEEEIGKDESVYFITDASGKVEQTIVSEHLFNRDGAEVLEDISSLKEIKNVKGDETFTQDGDKLVWQAGGKDIYYQGTTSAEAPVTQKVTYYLDGKEIKPEELAGKSGKVTIHYDYTNNTSYTEKIDGKDVTVSVPFAAVTTILLDDSFSNIKVENGRTEISGDNSMVIGYALPGLKESLGIKDGSLKDGKEIPDYFELTADVENFELSTAMTIVVNAGEFITNDKEDKEDNIGETINKLLDATEKLEDGSVELADGLEELESKTGDFKDGMDSLQSGLSDYLDGTKQLDDGIKTLKDGVEQLSQGALSLGDGVDQLKEGADSAVTGAKQLVAGYQGDGQTAGLVDGAQAVAEGAVKLDEAVDQLTGSISKSVTAQVQATLDSKINQTSALGLVKALGYQSVTVSNVTEVTAKVMASEAQLEAALQAQGADEATAAATYNTLLAGLCQAQGALSVAGSMSSEETGAGLGQLAAATESLKNGAAAVYEGVKKESEGTVQLEQGLETLEDGLKTLKENVPALTTGIKQLKDGAKELAKGSNTLVSNNQKLSDGVNELSDGTDKLVEGVGKLSDGSRELADGMIEFNKEGIDKLVNSYDGDIAELANNLQAVLDAGSDYQTFTSVAEGTKGSVKFIYKLGAIQTSAE